MVPVPFILVAVCLIGLAIDDLLERINGHCKRVDHNSGALVRLLAKIGHRPPDPRDM